MQDGKNKTAYYREYRPKTFDSVIGQRHITDTLAKEVCAGMVGHAYLFTGSRGTGKTTCAKILAKAVNCPHAAEHGGNPCNECDTCRRIDNGSVTDIVEMDAASNTRVDDVRDIIDNCEYAPMEVRYKVFIIDEVHMLSKSAFNALLKTLEEPPEYVKFILATTDVNKVLPTILSRCQRFDFRRIEPEDIAARLQYIADEENLTLDADAAGLIARVADGALRNAVSLLDQSASYGSHVTAETVRTITGLTNPEYLFSLISCIYEKDCAGALKILDELYLKACDMNFLCAQLIEHCRNLSITKIAERPENLIAATNSDIELMKKQAESFTVERLLYIQRAFEETEGLIKYSSSQRITIETTLMKLCISSLDLSPQGLTERINELERKLRATPAVSSPDYDRSEATLNSTLHSPHSTLASMTPQSPAPTAASVALPDGPIAEWAEILDEVKKVNMPLYSLMSDTSASVRDGKIVILTSRKALIDVLSQNENRLSLRKAIFDVTGSKQGIAINRTADPLDDFIQKAQQNNIKINLTP